MTIQHPAVKKLFREHFKGDRPIRGTLEEVKEFCETIRPKIEKMKDVRIDDNPRPYYHSERKEVRPVWEIVVMEESERYSYRSTTDFELVVNGRGELHIRHYSSDAPVSGSEEILSFLAACRERVERGQVLKKKRKKLRDFKTQAIIAQVKKMAKEDKFDFYTQTDTVKLKLFIRLTGSECIEIHVPFSKFQEILPDLRSAISSLRELNDRNIKFKLKKTPRFYSEGWITHDSLQET